jgi:hypothetical protein
VILMLRSSLWVGRLGRSPLCRKDQLDCVKTNTECTAILWWHFMPCCGAVHAQKQLFCLSAGQCSAAHRSTLPLFFYRPTMLIHYLDRVLLLVWLLSNMVGTC